MKAIVKFFSTALFLLLFISVQAQEKPKVYVVSNAHFDSQWNWDVQTSIRDYVSKTLNQNLFLLERYPNYIFNFEGGIKYYWMKEYYPDQYEKAKEYIRQGRWHVTGSSWDASDVNIPSPESLTRNILYGQLYYQDEFGVRGTDIFLPDCFGFGYTLPTIMAHSGLIGFSTQKLQWRSKPFFENNSKIPFEIGLWQGVDGSKVMLVADAHNYTTRWQAHDLSRDTTLIKLAQNSPLKTIYHYYGTGDTGGAPTVESVLSVEQSLKGDGPVQIISATSDQLYKDYLPYDKHPELPLYTGELLMDVHGTGCYTSEAAMKLYNRKNEVLGDAAERSAVVADWLGGQIYPKETINEAWKRFLWHQFHDDLTGTSIPRAYEFSWNDELLTQKQFTQVLTTSVGSVSRALDTQVKGTPLVIQNAVSQPVKGITEVTIDGVPTKQVFSVYDEKGKLIPSQMLSYDNNKIKFLVAANVLPVSYTVYDVRPGASPKASALKVSKNTIENSIYKVTLNANGDINSILDKRYNKELVKAGKSIRLALFTENESFSWPAWEIIKKTTDAEPIDITDGVKISIAEEGPVRAAICVERKYGESTFKQYIRLTEGGQDDRIDLVSEVDWQTTNALLKAEFPLSIDNEKATFDLGIGNVKRGNNTITAYEVPAHYWADLTATDNSYGVSVLNDSKYGWDKPNNHTLRLTLLHTPKTQRGYSYQDKQDFGYHTFTYSIVGHKDGYAEAKTVSKAEMLNQPLKAFTVKKHKGDLGRSFSFLQTSSDQLIVKALKKAEKSDGYIVRLYETTGKDARNIEVSFAGEIREANELNGVEDVIGKAAIQGNKLTVSASPFAIKTYYVKLKSGAKLTPPQSIPVDLKYNIKTASYNAFRSEANVDGKGYSYAAELLPSTLTAANIKFQLGEPALENGVRCEGDTLILPQNGQYNKLYLLAASLYGDNVATFYVDGKPHELLIPDYSGFIGQWRHTGHTEGFLKPAEVAYVGTHRHNSNGNLDAPYEFTYMFKYGIDIPKNAQKLVLTDDSKILLFAASLAVNENDDITPATELIATALKPDDLKMNVVARKSLLKGKPIIGKSTPNDANNANANNFRRFGRPEFAVDGNFGTQWFDMGQNGNTPFIEVDMEKENTIKGWFVFHGGRMGTNSFAAKDYKLEIKKNLNDQWQTVDTVTDNKESETNRLLSTPVTARYVRLTVLKGAQEGQTAARISEFEVY
ncbi:alpha-mannosidase [Bacteroidia bacterium]|nr:alpha-mannosidase [Bacteroidia bacterium]